MEGKEYPIFTTMYHPEYQLLDFVGKYKWPVVKDETTDEIAFRVSLHLNRVARNNNNRMMPEFEEHYQSKMLVNRNDSTPYPMIGGIIIYAFGYK